MNVKAVFCDIPQNYIACNEITATDINDSVSDIELLKDSYNEPYPIITIEYNKWRLDGTYKYAQKSKIPYISNMVSSDEATDSMYFFPETITITKKFLTAQSIKGITIVSGEESYITYATIKWYNGTTLLDSADIYPDNSKYYYDNQVSSCNKIEILVYAVNKPNRYLTIFSILEAKVHEFNNDTIMSCSILDEKNIINTELPCGSLEISLKGSFNDISFTSGQQIFIFRDEIKKGTYYLESFTRENINTVSLTAYDVFYILDNFPFMDVFIPVTYNSASGYYEIPLSSVLDYVFDRLPYNYTAPDINLHLRGSSRSVEENMGMYTAVNTRILRADTCREALVKIMAASRLKCDVQNGNHFVFTLWETTDPTEIPQSNTFIGGNITTEQAMHTVSVEVDHYAIVTKYFDNETDNTGPYWAEATRISLSVEDNNEHIYYASEDKTFSRTYIVGDLPDNLTLDLNYPGYFKYKFTDPSDIGTTKNMRLRIKTLENAPDISSVNTGITDGEDTGEINIALALADEPIDELLNHFKNYYRDNRIFEGQIIIPEDLHTGDTVKVHTEWQGDMVGIVEQIEYQFKGGQKLIGRIRVHAYG